MPLLIPIASFFEYLSHYKSGTYHLSGLQNRQRARNDLKSMRLKPIRIYLGLKLGFYAPSHNGNRLPALGQPLAQLKNTPIHTAESIGEKIDSPNQHIKFPHLIRTQNFNKIDKNGFTLIKT
jgi:hypothetical protein